MKTSPVRASSTCARTQVIPAQDGLSGANRKLTFLFLMLSACCILAQRSFGQIQSTTTCTGKGDWDVLSVMMMDPGLAAGNHMEGLTNGSPSAYIYTIWDQTGDKVYYVKNPQGNPWDINLYDSKYIYQWVTELQSYQGVNHWNDPTSCKKFNNGSDKSTADYSMRWAARCAVPGGASSSMWNTPSSQPNDTNYYTYVDKVRQTLSQNLDYSKLLLQKTGTMTITDNRPKTPKKFSITTMPLEYDYSCSVTNNVNSCKNREVFYYGLDTTVNPVDGIKHSYGWVQWKYYTNSTGGNADATAKWVLQNSSTTDQVMPGQISLNFQCF